MSCHNDYRLRLRNVNSLGEAYKKCLNDKQCKAIVRMANDWSIDPTSCDEKKEITFENSYYYMCYVGYSFKDSQTECVHEKIGNLFLFLDFRSAILKFLDMKS